jgi:ATP-dependent DNA ligase
MRLHPAESRVLKLAAETPAIFILFDMLLDMDGRSLLHAPLTQRRAALEKYFAAAGENQLLKLSPYTLHRGEAKAWLDQAGGSLDGRRSEARRWRLHARRARHAQGQASPHCRLRRGRVSLWRAQPRGRLASSISSRERPALTKRLESLVSPPGFTGKAPGGPSRWRTERSSEWQPVRPELVVDVSYDHITGDRFRHGTRLIRWRPDKSLRQCTFDQLNRDGSEGSLFHAFRSGYTSIFRAESAPLVWGPSLSP